MINQKTTGQLAHMNLGVTPVTPPSLDTVDPFGRRAYAWTPFTGMVRPAGRRVVVTSLVAGARYTRASFRVLPC